MYRFLSAVDVEQIKKSRVVAFPTDTVPALCARPDDGPGLEQLFILKQRPLQKSLMLMLPDLSWVSHYFEPTPDQWSMINRNAPGKITFILPLKVTVSLPPYLYQVVGDQQYVGFRCPDHAIAQEILSVTGPLAQTSLNLSGEGSIQNSDAISFKTALDFVFPFHNHPQLASTIVRLDHGGIEYIRHGAGELIL